MSPKDTGRQTYCLACRHASDPAEHLYDDKEDDIEDKRMQVRETALAKV